MKKLVTIVLVLVPILLNAQETEYTLSSFLEEGFKAPNTHHIGEAWLSFLVEADEDFGYNLTQATFSAGSTLDWHRHETAQVIVVLEGKGYYQERGKDPMIMKEGDVITCPKETEHWHTASAESSVSYIAIYGPSETVWTETLTQEYYDRVTAQLEGK